MNKDVYVCYTPYHLLISLVKSMLSPQKTLIVLSERLEKAYQYEINIKKMFDRDIGIDVLVISERDFHSSYRFYSKSVREFFQHHFSNIENFYLFNDTGTFPLYLQRNKIDYHLLEDGFNCLIDRRSLPRKEHYKDLIFRGIPLPHGFSKSCKTIEVNSIQGIFKDKRYKKYIEFPKRNFMEQLSSEHKKKISEVFAMMTYFEQLNGILILTQPLYQDNWDETITSEKEQVEFYQKIIEDYAHNQQVFFKVHPRDTVDYSSLDNVVFLEKDIPMEVYEMVSECHFTKGITHSSTALDFLSCVEEKIVLKNMK